MTKDAHRESAKIYPFPAGGRGSFAGRRVGIKAAVEFPSAQIADCGSGWYHEAAIREAEQMRKR
jgi:hypothetical protein